MIVAKTFIKFKKFDSPSIKNKGKSEGKKDKKERSSKPSIWKGKATTKDEKKGALKCFLYDGPHQVRECLTRAKLSAMVQKKEKEEEAWVSSLCLLNALKFRSSNEQ